MSIKGSTGDRSTVGSRKYQLGENLGNRPIPTHALRIISSTAEVQLGTALRIEKGKGLTPDEAFEVMRCARMLAENPHENLATTKEVIVDSDHVLIVGEFVEGESLFSLWQLSRARETKPTVEIALRILLDVLAGLQALHQVPDNHGKSASLIHGELGPSNVIVRLDGIAQLVQVCHIPQVGLRTAHIPPYLAPEVLLQEGKGDQKSDIYSVGAMLWETISGAPMIATEKVTDIIRFMLTGNLPAPRVPQEAPWANCLLDIVNRAISVDPSKRFSNAEQMRQAIASQAQGHIAERSQVAAWVTKLAGAQVLARRVRLCSPQEISRTSLSDPDKTPIPGRDSLEVEASATASHQTDTRPRWESPKGPTKGVIPFLRTDEPASRDSMIEIDYDPAPAPERRDPSFFRTHDPDYDPSEITRKGNIPIPPDEQEVTRVGEIPELSELRKAAARDSITSEVGPIRTKTAKGPPVATSSSKDSKAEVRPTLLSITESELSAVDFEVETSASKKAPPPPRIAKPSPSLSQTPTKALALDDAHLATESKESVLSTPSKAPIASKTPVVGLAPVKTDDNEARAKNAAPKPNATTQTTKSAVERTKSTLSGLSATKADKSSLKAQTTSSKDSPSAPKTEIGAAKEEKPSKTILSNPFMGASKSLGPDKPVAEASSDDAWDWPADDSIAEIGKTPSPEKGLVATGKKEEVKDRASVEKSAMEADKPASIGKMEADKPASIGKQVLAPPKEGSAVVSSFVPPGVTIRAEHRSGSRPEEEKSSAKAVVEPKEEAGASQPAVVAIPVVSLDGPPESKPASGPLWVPPKATSKEAEAIFPPARVAQSSRDPLVFEPESSSVERAVLLPAQGVSKQAEEPDDEFAVLRKKRGPSLLIIGATAAVLLIIVAVYWASRTSSSSIAVPAIPSAAEKSTTTATAQRVQAPPDEIPVATVKSAATDEKPSAEPTAQKAGGKATDADKPSNPGRAASPAESAPPKPKGKGTKGVPYDPLGI